MVVVTEENSCSLKDESLLLLAFMRSSLAPDARGILKEGGKDRERERYKPDWLGESRSLPTEVFAEVGNKSRGYKDDTNLVNHKLGSPLDSPTPSVIHCHNTSALSWPTF